MKGCRSRLLVAFLLEKNKVWNQIFFFFFKVLFLKFLTWTKCLWYFNSLENLGANLREFWSWARVLTYWVCCALEVGSHHAVMVEPLRSRRFPFGQISTTAKFSQPLEAKCLGCLLTKCEIVFFCLWDRLQNLSQDNQSSWLVTLARGRQNWGI